MATDRVLIEIATVANLAGVEAAKGGLLGLSGAMLAVTAGLGAITEGAKSFIEISESHAKAEANLGNAITNRGRNAKTVNDQVANFMQTNRDLISNQADVINSFAALVREGVSTRDLYRTMTTILNVAAAQNISLADATALVQSAEIGRNRGLQKLVGLTLAAIPAHASLAEKHKIIAHNLEMVAVAYKHGSDAITPLERSTNRLSNDWQDMANKNGPALVGVLDKILKGTDDFLTALSKSDSGAGAWAHLAQGIIYWGGLIEAAISAIATSWDDLITSMGGETGKEVTPYGGRGAGAGGKTVVPKKGPPPAPPTPYGGGASNQYTPPPSPDKYLHIPGTTVPYKPKPTVGSQTVPISINLSVKVDPAKETYYTKKMKLLLGV